MRSLWQVSVLGTALVVAACGATRTRDGTAPPSGDRVLSQEEIEMSSAGNLYDVIRMRRPRWLQRSQTRPTSLSHAQAEVVVYLDGQRFGGPESLQRLTAVSAQWVEFLTPSEAQSRFGHDNMGGVIHVHSRGTPTERD